MILAFLFIQYLKSDLYSPFDENELNELKSNIENTQLLPQKFIKTFNKVNEITNTNGKFFDGLRGTSNKVCPCLYVSRMSFELYNSRIKTNTYVLSWKLEKDFSQEKCLSYFAQIYDFANENIGIENASNFYFQKKLEDLNDEEMSILVLVMKNSSLYNPLRNMEGIKKRLEEINN